MNTKDVNDTIQTLLNLDSVELEDYWIFKVDDSLFDRVDIILEEDGTYTYRRYMYKYHLLLVL